FFIILTNLKLPLPSTKAIKQVQRENLGDFMKITSIIFCSMLLFAQVSTQARETSEVSVMAYNLENLFDTSHDEGKEDWTYLPLAFKCSSKQVQKYCQA